MIKLPKATKSDWIDFDEGQRIKVDYPKGAQVHHLQDLMIKSNKDGEIDVANFMEYARYFIKYTIKDWEGFDTPCKLKKNALDDELWYLITEDITQTQILFAKISEVVSWGEVEKKS